MSSESPPFMMTNRAKAANNTKATMIFHIQVFLKKSKKALVEEGLTLGV
jgi:hypothetical protein